VSAETSSERIDEISPEGCFGLLFGEAVARAAAILREIGAEEDMIWESCKRAIAALLRMMNETDCNNRQADSHTRIDQVRERLADGTWLQ